MVVLQFTLGTRPRGLVGAIKTAVTITATRPFEIISHFLFSFGDSGDQLPTAEFGHPIDRCFIDLASEFAFPNVDFHGFCSSLLSVYNISHNFLFVNTFFKKIKKIFLGARRHKL